MARQASAAQVSSYPVAHMFAPQPPAPVAISRGQADQGTNAGSIWLFRGLFGLNLSLWMGIVVAIRQMI